MRLKFAGAIAAVLFIGVAANGRTLEVPYDDIPSKTVILGRLGIPIGRPALLHGKKARRGPNPNCFIVDKINGQPVPPGTDIYVENTGISKWADGTEATLRGHEVGTVRYRTMHDGNFDDADPRFHPEQRVFLDFVIEKVIEPQGLQPFSNSRP